VPGAYIPSKGDRIEHRRWGISRRGTVHYADELQVLIRWDDGASSSLPLDAEGLRVLGQPSDGSAAAPSAAAIV
jgi:hypothetical protein